MLCCAMDATGEEGTPRDGSGTAGFDGLLIGSDQTYCIDPPNLVKTQRTTASPITVLSKLAKVPRESVIVMVGLSGLRVRAFHRSSRGGTSFCLDLTPSSCAAWTPHPGSPGDLRPRHPFDLVCDP